LRLAVPRLRDLQETSLLEEPLYRRLFQFASVGMIMFYSGGYGVIFSWAFYRLAGSRTFERQGLLIGSLFLAGIGATILVTAAVNLRFVLLERVVPAEIDRIEYRQVENLRVQRKLEEEALFRRNLNDTFVLQSLELKEVRFFDDCLYKFQPGVNVLLGKNGYGKTLLLRTLAALIQNNREYSEQLFDWKQTKDFDFEADSGPRLRLEVTQNNKTQETIRDALDFRKAAGKIPLLAIPDSRFINRAQVTVGPTPAGYEPLSSSAARNFLTQNPY